MLGQNVDVRIRTQTLFLQHLKNEVKRFYVKSVIHSKRSGLDIFGSSWQIRIKESWTYLFCLFSRDYRHTHWIKKKRLIQQIRSKALRNLHACTHTHTLENMSHWNRHNFRQNHCDNPRRMSAKFMPFNFCILRSLFFFILLHSLKMILLSNKIFVCSLYKMKYIRHVWNKLSANSQITK